MGEFSLVSSFLIPFALIVSEGIIGGLDSANRFVTAALVACLSFVGLNSEKILLKCVFNKFCVILRVREDRVPAFKF